VETLEAVLPNGSTGDSLLLLRGTAGGEVLACDAGDPSRIPPREVLRLSHLLVSHCHVDHFVGFDALVRPRVCRPERLVAHGPEGFLDRVQARLAGYTWNLVDGNHFVIEAREVHEDRVKRATFDSGHSFARREEPDEPRDGLGCLEDLGFRFESAALDHHVVSQGWAVQRPRRISVLTDRLAESGLVAGAWLGQLKAAISQDVPTREIELPTGARRTAGELARELLEIGPGDRVAYVTDTVCDARTRPRIVALAAGADVFACGAPFADDAQERAALTRHLTASQAGSMAAEAGAKTLLLFHVSDRYGGRVERHVEEANDAAKGRVRVEVQEALPMQG
jgi:ribonuclease Z